MTAPIAIDDRTEWLEADGLGGFASGTTAGLRTRRYHALLLAATTPPTGRMVLVNGLDAWIERPEGSEYLTRQRYAPGVVAPEAGATLESFSDEPWPDVDLAAARRNPSRARALRHPRIACRGHAVAPRRKAGGVASGGQALPLWSRLTFDAPREPGVPVFSRGARASA